MRIRIPITILAFAAIICLATACKNKEPISPVEQKEPATRFIMQGHFEKPDVCVNSAAAAGIVACLITCCTLMRGPKRRLSF